MMTNHKNSNILLFYKILPPEIRRKFKDVYSQLIYISPSRFHQRLLYNQFYPHERALLSYHLGISQEILFPEKEPVFEIHPTYKAKNEPLYKSFFNEKYIYEPEKIAELLSIQKIPIQ